MLARYVLHRLVWLSVLVSVGIGSFMARNLWDGREDLLHHAQIANRNLSHTLAVGLQWGVAAVDKDVQDMVALLKAADVDGHDAFIHAALMVVGSPVLILDAQGRGVKSVASSGILGDYANRDFFLALQGGAHQGLFIGTPQVLEPGGPLLLPMARAWFHGDGRFAGVVVGSITMAQLDGWLSGMVVENGSAVSVLRSDGRLLTRVPPVGHVHEENVAAIHLQHWAAQPQGVFENTSATDGVQRIHHFERVADAPLVVNVAQARSEILRTWYATAWKVAGFAGLLVAGNLGLTLLFVRELERRRQTEQALHTEKDRMQHMALHDALTGLPNRVLLKDRIKQAMHQAQRDHTTLALLYLDVDGFKQVNDRWGHEVGDQVLVHIATELQQAARASDTACRLGGDEFVLVLPECSMVDLHTRIARVRQACSTPCWHQGENLQQVYDVSIGIALYPTHAGSCPDLLRQADAALYHAKASGRGQVMLCDGQGGFTPLPTPCPPAADVPSAAQ